MSVSIHIFIGKIIVVSIHELLLIWLNIHDKWSPQGVIAKVFDWSLVASEFKLQLNLEIMGIKGCSTPTKKKKKNWNLTISLVSYQEHHFFVAESCVLPLCREYSQCNSSPADSADKYM